MLTAWKSGLSTDAAPPPVMCRSSRMPVLWTTVKQPSLLFQGRRRSRRLDCELDLAPALGGSRDRSPNPWDGLYPPSAQHRAVASTRRAPLPPLHKPASRIGHGHQVPQPHQPHQPHLGPPRRRRPPAFGLLPGRRAPRRAQGNPRREFHGSASGRHSHNVTVMQSLATGQTVPRQADAAGRCSPGYAAPLSGPVQTLPLHRRFCVPKRTVHRAVAGVGHRWTFRVCYA